MKIKKLTLIELLITIMVLGLLAALAIPQFTGVKANADVASFKNDIDTLTKAIDESYVKSDSLPLGEKITLTSSELLDTIYATGDSGTNLYKIDIAKSGEYHSKLKSKIDADSYFIYSMETGKVFYTKAMINGEDQIFYTMEYIALKNAKIGSKALINGMAISQTEPVQTITGQVPLNFNVEVSVNGAIVPVTTEDVVFEGEINLMAAVKYKTFTAETTLSNGINTVSVKVNSSVSNFKINLGDDEIPIVPDVPTSKPVAVISMTPELDLTTTTNIVWGYENSTAVEGRTITNAEWEGKQDLYAVNGDYTVKLRVQDSTGIWSDWTEKTFTVSTKPVAVITMTPEENLTTTTNITWSYADSTASGSKTITDAQWEGKQDSYTTDGSYTVKLKVKDSSGVWSDWTQKTFIVVQPDGVKSIIAGLHFTLLLKEDGTLWATGKNEYGQLGNGTTNNSNTFIQIQSNVKSVVAGDYHTVVLKEDGTLWATGRNNKGQLGNGSTTDSSSFIQVQANVKDIFAKNLRTFIIKEDNSLWSTGHNDYGQLGIGNTTDRNSFIQVQSGVKNVELGNYHTLIVKEDGTLWATGKNTSGQLGTGNKINQNTFLQVNTNVKSVAVSSHYTFVIKDDNTLWATGWNYYGTLGSGNTTDSNVFIHVQSNVKSVVVGGNHALIIKEDNTLWITGSNAFGQLGTDTFNDASTFQQVQSNVKTIVATADRSFIIKQDGTLWATGKNDYGQTGNGNNTDLKVFTQVQTGVSKISSNYYYTIIVKNGGAILGTGHNAYGQLGTGNFNSSNLFIQSQQ